MVNVKRRPAAQLVMQASPAVVRAAEIQRPVNKWDGLDEMIACQGYNSGARSTQLYIEGHGGRVKF